MYSDEFLDDPGHYRIFDSDDNTLKSKLLRAYHDSPLGMHRGREATYHSLASEGEGEEKPHRGMGKATQRWVAR